MKSNNLSELSDLSGRNWSWVKLGEVCETTSGGTPSRKNPKYYDGKIPWIKSGELNFNTIRDSEEKITADAIENSNAKILEKGTLLIALYGATVGRLAFLGIEAATNQAVAAIFTPKNLSSKFLYWFLFSYREKLLTQRIGGAQPNISQGTLRNIPIPLPPLAEQKKIVEKIEELFSGLDSGVASLKKAKEQIKLYRQSVLVSAFSGKLTTKFTKNTENLSELSVLSGLPHGWKWVKLGEVTNNFDGQRIPLSKEVRAKRKGEYRYFGATEIIDYIDDYIFDGTYLLIGEDGANLLSKSRPLSFIVDGKFWVNNHAHVLQTKNGLKIKYLNYFFNSISLGSYVTGSAQPKLTQKNLNKIPLPLAPLNQQTQIVSEIEKRFSEADNLEKAIDDSLEKSEALRQSILKQAFEGRLV
ncbi:MAG: restriction endonuclease subunit S [Ignavibacteriaceae bacterium]|jgi:type I restriction enzyme S subunit|nr:restriction endonuclease subunit S [Ignavibacteriaceae bacterium]